MNICIITGKIITKLEYKFMLEKNKYAIIIFKVKIENKEIITVKAYNDIADETYKSLLKEDRIVIEGYLRNNKKK